MAAVAHRDSRQSRRGTYVGTGTREEKSTLVNEKELSLKYCRRMNMSWKSKEEGDLLRALGVAPAFVEEERVFCLSLALFAKIGS